MHHRRFTPVENEFRYRVFMVYLDLEELDRVPKLSRWWSDKWYSFARFDRRNFHGPAEVPLLEAVRQTVARTFGEYPEGPVRLLANWRYFGCGKNPLCTYYCFDKSGRQLRYLLAEVNNTPWGESHAYVLQCQEAGIQTFSFAKVFHVSPFNELAMRDQWRSSAPDKSLHIHMRIGARGAALQMLGSG